MGVVGKGDYLCAQCGTWHVQQQGDTCRRCMRQTWTVYTSEKARQQRLGDRRLALQRAPEAPPLQRSVTISHVEYEIVWDGSVR